MTLSESPTAPTVPDVHDVDISEPADDSDVAGISDDELARLAMAADGDAVPGPDAVPMAVYLEGMGGLPGWYMPAATTTARSGRRTAAVALIVASFLVINGLGLCITYGQLVAA